MLLNRRVEMEQFDISSKILNVVAVSEKLNFIVAKKIITAFRNVRIILKLFPTLENEQQRRTAFIFRFKTGKKYFFETSLTHW